jgi:hypothetical protein
VAIHLGKGSALILIDVGILPAFAGMKQVSCQLVVLRLWGKQKLFRAWSRWLRHACVCSRQERYKWEAERQVLKGEFHRLQQMLNEEQQARDRENIEGNTVSRMRLLQERNISELRAGLTLALQEREAAEARCTEAWTVGLVNGRQASELQAALDSARERILTAEGERDSAMRRASTVQAVEAAQLHNMHSAWEQVEAETKAKNEAEDRLAQIEVILAATQQRYLSATVKRQNESNAAKTTAQKAQQTQNGLVQQIRQEQDTNLEAAKLAGALKKRVHEQESALSLLRQQLASMTDAAKTTAQKAQQTQNNLVQQIRQEQDTNLEAAKLAGALKRRVHGFKQPQEEVLLMKEELARISERMVALMAEKDSAVALAEEREEQMVQHQQELRAQRVKAEILQEKLAEIQQLHEAAKSSLLRNQKQLLTSRQQMSQKVANTKKMEREKERLKTQRGRLPARSEQRAQQVQYPQDGRGCEGYTLGEETEVQAQQLGGELRTHPHPRPHSPQHPYPHSYLHSQSQLQAPAVPVYEQFTGAVGANNIGANSSAAGRANNMYSKHEMLWSLVQSFDGT